MLRYFLTLFVFIGFYANALAQSPAPLKFKSQDNSIKNITAGTKPNPNSLIIKYHAAPSSAKQAKSALSVSSATKISIKPLWPSKKSGLTQMSQSSGSFAHDNYYIAEFDSSISNSELENIKNKLAASSTIAYVQTNQYYELDSFTPNDSAYSSQWNLSMIQAPEAWDITKGNSSVKVGIIDTGIDYTHPDLIPNLYINSAEDLNQNGTFEPWPSAEKRDPISYELDENGISGDFDDLDQDQNGYTDDVIGWDFVSQPLNVDHLNGYSDYQTPDADPFDENSHGTACAGIVAAATNNTIGVAGIAPNCKVVALRVFTASGYADDKDIASAIVYAADNNIRVLNMSFGDVTLSALLRDAVQYAHANGVVMCASAGNDGGDGQHYPSGFDEVISTVATTTEDNLTSFSTYGITVDIGAPGIGIPTTYPFYDGYYTSSFGGTSAAAPHVAAAAALVLSENPDFTTDQVRGVLTSTANDIILEGWDHFSGSGRLNIYLALQAVGTPVAKITSPQYDAGFSTENKVAIVGTATSPNFQRYELSYVAGTKYNETWQPITKSAYQAINDTLGVWDISSLADSTYTLRLAVHQTNGKTIEIRQRIFLDRSAPNVSGFTITDAYLNESHGLFLYTESDDLTEAQLYYRPTGATSPFQMYSLDDITRSHKCFLQSYVLEPGIAYDFYFKLTNRSGLNAETNTLSGTLNPEIVQTPSLNGAQFSARQTTKLPKGYYLNKLADFNNNGRFEVIMNEALPLEGKKYGYLKRFEFNSASQTFTLLDSVAAPYIPRDVGDFNQDGLLDLLVQSGGKTILYSQSDLNASPFSKKLYADTLSGNLWGAKMADTKNNGQNELLARNDTAYFILDQSFSKIATLPNPVTKSKDGSRPTFEEPKVLVEDFDQDGKPEILMGDYDGNFFIYEYSGSGNAYENAWLYRTPYIGGSNWLVSGNFLGNGKKQFIIGYHSDENSNALGEYDPQIWIFECYQASGDNTYEQIWKQAFYNYKPAFYFPSASASGDLDGDGKEELFILTYPNLYIFSWSDVHGTFKPKWMHPNASANGIVVQDFDGNNLKDVIFSDDLNALVYEYQNSTGPLPPIGITYEPLSQTKVQLNWLPSEAATSYKIYRAPYLSSASTPTTLVKETADTTFLDSTLSTDHDFYIYAITAKSAAEESDTSAYFIVKPHQQPRLSDARYESQAFLRISFSEPISPYSINASTLTITDRLNNEFYAGSITLAKGGTDAVLSFKHNPLPEGKYQVKAQNVQDVYYGTLDTAYNKRSFVVQSSVDTSFYITQNQILSKTQLLVKFNKPVLESSAQKLQNYLLSPFGSVTKAELNNENTELTLTLSGVEQGLGGLGYEQYLEISNLLSQDGYQIDSEHGGNIITFAASKETLKEAFVYPNPYRIVNANTKIMFANLTESGTIDIYSLSGKHLQRISYNTINGGAEWDGKNKNGKKLASGIYIYRIKSSTNEEKIGKLAIIK